MRIRTPNRSRGRTDGERTARPVVPQIRMATACRTMPKPIVPISIRSKSLFSSGRSTRSMTRPIAAVTAMATTMATAKGSLEVR